MSTASVRVEAEMIDSQKGTDLAISSYNYGKVEKPSRSRDFREKKSLSREHMFIEEHRYLFVDFSPSIRRESVRKAQ